MTSITWWSPFWAAWLARVISSADAFFRTGTPAGAASFSAMGVTLRATAAVLTPSVRWIAASADAGASIAKPWNAWVYSRSVVTLAEGRASATEAVIRSRVCACSAPASSWTMIVVGSSLDEAGAGFADCSTLGGVGPEWGRTPPSAANAAGTASVVTPRVPATTSASADVLRWVI